MIISPLLQSLKLASRLNKNTRSVVLRRSSATTASRFASSLPPQGDNDEVESSGGNDAISTPSNAILFPWRHESLPVPRLVPGTPEQKNIGLLLTSKSQKVYGNSSLNAVVTAYMFLNVPWYELLWISHFKDELSSDMSWSFTQGVASLLSNIPLSGGGDRIPSNRIIKDRDDGTSEIDFRETIEISRNAENGSYRIAVENNDDVVYGTISSESDGSNYTNDMIPPRKIFEAKAIELYQSSISEVANHLEKQRFELRLKMVPNNFEFVTLYAIPYLSRRNAKSDPELLGFYDKMLNETSSRRAPYLSKLRQEHLETNRYMESTIIAQCLVWCDELFYVKNLTTGEIMQGRVGADDESSSELQKTPHLVRMERTVITKKEEGGGLSNEQEDWIITDIDDLLDGNLLI